VDHGQGPSDRGLHPHGRPAGVLAGDEGEATRKAEIVTKEMVLALLKRLDACGDAVEWFTAWPSPKQAWAACKRPDWMLWIAARLGIRGPMLHAAADCAETAKHMWPPGPECGDAIAACRAVADDDTAENRSAANSAARAADSAANSAANSAASAAYGAAYGAADSADRAAYSAASAAYGAAYGAADSAADKHMADLVRARIPYAIIKKAAKEFTC
jgi:hypothetical protein